MRIEIFIKLKIRSKYYNTYFPVAFILNKLHLKSNITRREWRFICGE